MPTDYININFRLSTESNEEMEDDSNQSQSDQSIDLNQTTNSSGYMTRSKKANLIFSVSRVENHLRKGRYAERIGKTASVYLASVLEYLVAEMVELAGDMTHKSKRKRITPRDIALVIKNDEELAKLCSNVTIPEGGVQPHIHEVLLKPTQRPRKRRVRFSQNYVETPSSSKGKSIYKQPKKNIISDTDTDDDSDLQMD